MKYFFAGSTSPTGIAVLNRLIPILGESNICCLARATSDIVPLQKLGVKIHLGNILEPDSYASELNREVVYIDMTHPKHYHISLDAIQNAGINRAYFVTTTGIYSQYNDCADIYKLNESKIKESGIAYTILRPTMIYGHSKDKNMSRLVKFLNKYPVFPLLGNGTSLMQPVYIDDLANGIAMAVLQNNTEMQEYNLAGLNPISFREVVDTILEKINRKTKVLMVNVGVSLGAKLATISEYIPQFPITQEQILRIQEDKVFDISKAQQDLSYSPRSFEEGIQLEIEAMRRTGLII